MYTNNCTDLPNCFSICICIRRFLSAGSRGARAFSSQFIYRFNSTFQMSYDDDEKILFKELFSKETTLANSDDFKDKTIDELQKLLKIAVQNENYETAAKIRDEISNR